MLLKWLFLLWIGPNFGSGQASGHQRRAIIEPSIVNGATTTIEKHPHLVSLQLPDRGHHCGGSIINQDTILTAAHCCGSVRDCYAMTIHAGITNMNDTGFISPISKMFQHELYENDIHFDRMYNDIMILKLQNPLEFSTKIQPIKLAEPDVELEEGIEALVAGWGRTNETIINSLSHTLLEIAVPIVALDECKKAFERALPIEKEQICTATTDMKSALNGDSGGALTVKGVLYGIVSFVATDLKTGAPNVYTNVASYRNWIRGQAGI